MRIMLLSPLLLLGACNVSTDNNAVTVQYDQNTAENAASDVGNTAQGIGAAIANDADRTAAKVNNSSIVADHDDNTQDSNTTDNRQ
jgi:adenylosuccinate synthase